MSEFTGTAGDESPSEAAGNPDAAEGAEVGAEARLEGVTDESEGAAAEPEVEAVDPAKTILLEDGTRVDRAADFEGNYFKVKSADGQWFEHVAEVAGEWVYRKQ